MAALIACLDLSIFLVGAGPRRVDAGSMSRELQITSFCAPQRVDAEILDAAHQADTRVVATARGHSGACRRFRSVSDLPIPRG